MKKKSSTCSSANSIVQTFWSIPTEWRKGLELFANKSFIFFVLMYSFYLTSIAIVIFSCSRDQLSRKKKKKRSKLESVSYSAGFFWLFFFFQKISLTCVTWAKNEEIRYSTYIYLNDVSMKRDKTKFLLSINRYIRLMSHSKNNKHILSLSLSFSFFSSIRSDFEWSSSRNSSFNTKGTSQISSLYIHKALRN